MLKDEIAALGEEPEIDTSDIDSDEQVKALKEQIKKIKDKKRQKKRSWKKAAKEKSWGKKQTRLKAIEGVKKEILFMGETPMSEYEFTSEDEYIAALRKQVEKLKKLKEKRNLKSMQQYQIGMFQCLKFWDYNVCKRKCDISWFR